MYDDVIENLDRDMEAAISRLEDVAKVHTKIEDFHGDFFQVSRGFYGLTVNEVDLLFLVGLWLQHHFLRNHVSHKI